MVNLTTLFQAIVALLAAIITYKVIPWIQSKTTNEQRKMLDATVNTLVFAAEQLYGAGKGQEKLEFVLAELNKRGFEADRVAVEAAVKEFTDILHFNKE